MLFMSKFYNECIVFTEASSFSCNCCGAGEYRGMDGLSVLLLINKPAPQMLKCVDSVKACIHAQCVNLCRLWVFCSQQTKRKPVHFNIIDVWECFCSTCATDQFLSEHFLLSTSMAYRKNWSSIFWRGESTVCPDWAPSTPEYVIHFLIFHWV